MQGLGPEGWRLVYWPHLGFEDVWLAEAWALRAAAEDRHLPNIVEWAQVSAQALGTTLLLLERREENKLVAYAVVELEQSHLDLRVGPRLLYRRRLKALKITGGVVANLPPAGLAAALGDLLLFLRRYYRNVAIHLHAIPPAVLQALHAEPRYASGTLALPEGRMEHYRLDLPASTDDLFTILNRRTRSNFRRHRRRLELKCGTGNIRLEGFSRPDQVNLFLDEAVAIARRSYQYQLLHTGVASNERRHEWMFDIAHAGWWRGHLLWCGNQTVAFLVSVRIGDTHYGLEMGYDPLWAEWSVGTVALLELIRELIDSDDPPASLDFSVWRSGL